MYIYICYYIYSMRTIAPLRLKVRMLKKFEVIETHLYGCVTWTLRAEDFAKKSFERLTAKSSCELYWLPAPTFCTDHATLSYAKAPKKTR